MIPRVGVVGTGWWATTAHLPSLRAYDRCELLAVCDTRRDRAQEVARHFDIPHVFDDARELIEAVDAVVVATPHSTHYAIALAALRAGRHTLVEKPLALTAGEAFALVRAAEGSGVGLTVGYTAQHTSPARFAREVVQSGRIGDPVQVVAEFSSSTATFFESSAEPTEPNVPHPRTYATSGLGGGQAHTQLTHLVGMMHWVLADDAAEVFCYMDRRGLAVDVVDAATFRLRGGGLGLAASTGTSVGVPARHTLRYYGTAGMLEQDMGTARTVLYVPGADPVVCECRDGESTYPLEEPARLLVDLATGQGENVAPGRWAAAAVAFVEAAHRSAASGLPEDVHAP
ncbi:MAG TPA: Gfo/Idh/MocA family oxidoreductase [Actinopolymorphaceae bacterium]